MKTESILSRLLELISTFFVDFTLNDEYIKKNANSF